MHFSFAFIFHFSYPLFIGFWVIFIFQNNHLLENLIHLRNAKEDTLFWAEEHEKVPECPQKWFQRSFDNRCLFAVYEKNELLF